MKKMIFIACVMITNCLSMIAQESKKDFNGQIEFTISMDTLISSREKGIPITLIIKNIYKKKISISNPSHWGNSIPYVMYVGDWVPMIRVKPDPSFINDFVVIERDSIYKVYFNLCLDKLFNLGAYSNKGKLEIFFIYYGIFKDEHEIISNSKIVSNVRQFYIK